MAAESQGDQDIEKRIVEYCKDKPKPVNEKTLVKHLNVDPLNVAKAINNLLRKGAIDIKTGSKSQGISISLKTSGKQKIKGDNEKKVIYEIIGAAGNKGIWIHDILKKSGLPQTLVTKILKILESEKLIKAITSVLERRKKCYMLYNLEPDKSITGGAWYNEEDFDHEFVEVIHQQCYKYLYAKLVRAKAEHKNLLTQRQFASATTEDVRKHISELRISNQELSLQDVEAILNTIVYDGKAEKIIKMDISGHSSSDSGSVVSYLCVESLVESVGLMNVPCGFCPVINRCTENGEISPSTCKYMKEWLEY